MVHEYSSILLVKGDTYLIICMLIGKYCPYLLCYGILSFLNQRTFIYHFSRYHRFRLLF